MPVFLNPTQFADHKAYVPLIKKALALLKPGVVHEFVYFKEYPFTGKKQPLLLVDYSSSCRTAIIKSKLSASAEGEVRVTPTDQLSFTTTKGGMDLDVLRRTLASMGSGIREIQAAPEPGEVSPADGQPAAGEAPPVRPQVAAPSRGGSTPAADAPGAPLATPFQPRTKSPERAGVKVAISSQAAESELEEWIAMLRKAKLPVQGAKLNSILDAAQKLVNEGEFAKAQEALTKLVSWVQYPGVAVWALDPAQRKLQVEQLGEQCTALGVLIEARRKTEDQWKQEAKEAVSIRNDLATFNTLMQSAIKRADPEAAKKVFDTWAGLQKRRSNLAQELKKGWLDEKVTRLAQEIRHNKKSLNADAATEYGRDELLELAQMGEVQLARYRKQNPNAASVKDLEKKLQVAEIAAIHGYSTAEYAPIHDILRGTEPKTDEQKKKLEADKKRLATFIKALDKAIQQLPAYVPAPGTTLVRCDKTFWAQLVDELGSTATRTEKSFMSAGFKKVSGFGNLEMHITSVKTGRDITMFSLHETEGEVLFPAGSKFKLHRAEIADPGAPGKTLTLTQASEFKKFLTPELLAGKFYYEQLS